MSNTDQVLKHQDLGVDGTSPDAETPAAPSGGAGGRVLPAASVLPAAAGRPSFAEVYGEHFKAVWLGLRRFGVWERELDDAAHDVFIVVHRRLSDYDPARPLRPWLLGIAARVASEFRRKSQNRHEVVSEDTETESDRLPTHTPAYGVRADRALDDKQRRQLLHKALDTLEVDRRTVLVLHDIEGHPMPDISAALDVNVNTLYARLRNARIDLKAAVTALTTTPSPGSVGGAP
ncbi:MAG: sigma-70 family RNA polymerase sigma factor [Deltaproteobacteria bacterium]|nr:sigma-70 family RNA polymerase sigma factor [Deltaproteobacteria bacterium]